MNNLDWTYINEISGMDNQLNLMNLKQDVTGIIAVFMYL
jgi:hypothetical protein